MHTTTKQISSIVFNAVKDENNLILSKLKQRKQEKDFMKIYHKEGDKVICSSRIKEAEGRTKLISSYFKWKTKGTKYERY